MGAVNSAVFGYFNSYKVLHWWKESNYEVLDVHVNPLRASKSIGWFLYEGNTGT